MFRTSEKRLTQSEFRTKNALKKSGNRIKSPRRASHHRGRRCTTHAAGDHTPHRHTTTPQAGPATASGMPATMARKAGMQHRRPHRCTPRRRRSYARRHTTHRRKHAPPPTPARPHHDKQGGQAHHRGRRCTPRRRRSYATAGAPPTGRKYTPPHLRHAVTMTSRAGNPPEGPQVHTTRPARSYAPQVNHHTASRPCHRLRYASP